MNIVDSSCWLEFFSGSSVGDKISPVIENTKELIVPSITLYEVFKKILIEVDEDSALLAVAHMKQGIVIELDSDLAIYAAKIGKEYQLAMADSIIYAVSKKVILYYGHKISILRIWKMLNILKKRNNRTIAST